jgi:hypothetical protein
LTIYCIEVFGKLIAVRKVYIEVSQVIFSLYSDERDRVTIFLIVRSGVRQLCMAD